VPALSEVDRFNTAEFTVEVSQDIPDLLFGLKEKFFIPVPLLAVKVSEKVVA
jgi:hypothetical protein